MTGNFANWGEMIFWRDALLCVRGVGCTCVDHGVAVGLSMVFPCAIYALGLDGVRPSSARGLFVMLGGMHSCASGAWVVHVLSMVSLQSVFSL